MHLRSSKRRNVVGTAKPIMQRKLKKSFHKLYWIFDCCSTSSSGLLPFCIRQHIFSFISVEIKFLIMLPHKIKTHKKDSLGEKVFAFPHPPNDHPIFYHPFHHFVVDKHCLQFENFVYSVTICFNGEKKFSSLFFLSFLSLFCCIVDDALPSGEPRTLENIQAFVHSFQQNEFYVTIIPNAQFWMWANAKKRSFNWL